jgi:hypothetical protein
VGGIDPSDLMWPAHWTCCKLGYEMEGCTKTFHRGPYMDDYNNAPRKYEWPDERMQTLFKKCVSALWQKKMDEQYSYDDDTLVRKLRKITSEEGVSQLSSFNHFSLYSQAWAPYQWFATSWASTCC